jgi:hypothetical protein
MQLLTEFAALIVPLILYGWPLVRSFKDPRRFERARYRRQMARGPFRHVALGAATGATTGLALLIGWQNAGLRWLWLTLGILMLGLALLAALAGAMAQLNPTAIRQPPTELSDASLDILTRRRRISQPIVMLLLVLWTYSWRHLLVGSS